ncbi:MAG: PIG-L family deacetylase [Clostridia bacterium]|nr:PIG-L family deacetylase [Clostridia bacterium]
MIFMLLFVPALAEEAQDITGECTFVRKTSQVDFKPILDRNYASFFTMNPNRVVEVRAEEDISGVYLQFFRYAYPLNIQYEQDGEWIFHNTTDGTYLTAYVPLPEGTRKIQIINKSGKKVDLAEVSIFGAGDKPGHIPEWEAPAKADLLLVSTHPDDELLWFGGLLPTYAGEKDLAVQVAYLVPSIGYRRLELLDGLWHCGVERYPLFLEMLDKRAPNLKKQYELWNRNTLLEKVVTAIRQVQPEVIVTQDERGEYGHGAHRACADVCKQAIIDAADAAKYKKSVQEYGVWQAKKLYLHLYGENQIRFNWREPLSVFEGKDGLTVAAEALAFHKSQTMGGWAMEEGGQYDNALFGLFFSTVGEDIEKNDLMENIPEEWLAGTAD